MADVEPRKAPSGQISEVHPRSLSFVVRTSSRASTKDLSLCSWLVNGDMNAWEHLGAQVERVPIGETNAAVTGGAANCFRDFGAVDAAAFVIELHPENSHGIVWSGGQLVE